MSARQAVLEIRERVVAEQATGIVQRMAGLGTFYAEGGVQLSLEQARADLLVGKPVEVPNAGAGSYRSFFHTLGFRDSKTLETTASSGDWTIAVQDKDCRWYPATQVNRYPYHGFTYQLDITAGPLTSWRHVWQFINHY